MNTSSVRTVGAVAAVFLSLTLSVFAQTPGDRAGTSAPSTTPYPAWAYPWDPDFKVPPADDVPQSLPGSAAAFSWKQARDLFFSPDWHPDSRRGMPEIVARGRGPNVRACGSCHRAEGTGGPENSSLAGQSAAYLVQQMKDFKSGARKFSGPQRSAVLLMTAAANAMTDAEVQAAAEYFSALKPKKNINVLETDTVPKTYIARLFFVKRPEGGTEPLGRRILEVPNDVEQFELRDTLSQFTAYVPVGSVAKGEVLVRTGGAGTTVACATCHGPELKGVGPFPGIAGRSPSYTVRQLYDLKHGARSGASSVLMKPTVERLTEDDMISLAAYLATLPP